MLSHMYDINYFNWAREIEHLLCQHGFAYAWFNQGVENEKLFLTLFSQRLKDNYLQHWYSSVETCSKLKIYRYIKTSYEKERYIDVLNIRKFRHCYAQFRTGVHDLEVEKGRCRNLPLEDRLCRVCSENVVEDEYHFVLKCIEYADIRTFYIPSKYYVSPSIHKLHILLANKHEVTIRNLAQYIYHALIRRKQRLENE